MRRLLALCVFVALCAPAQAAYVQKSGTNLTLSGQPWKFTGLNIYQAGGSCGYNTDLPSDLTAWGSGKEALRTWFFQYGATGLFGLRDWSTFDSVIADAKAKNIKVIPVLINQWHHCEGWSSESDGYKPRSWYQTLYNYLPTSPGMPRTYPQWVQEVVTRYRNEDTILAWQMVNEAEARESLNGTCNESSAATALKTFAHNIGSLIRYYAPNHLISFGTIGSGQCGTSAGNYQSVHDSQYVDLCSYHDYGAPLTPIPGDQWNGLQVRINQCNALNKPLFVGEVGVRSDAVGGSLQARANAYEAKVAAQFNAGTDGFLPWEWRDAAHGGSSTTGLPIGPGDPTLTVLGAH